MKIFIAYARTSDDQVTIVLDEKGDLLHTWSSWDGEEVGDNMVRVLTALGHDVQYEIDPSAFERVRSQVARENGVGPDEIELDEDF